MKEFIEKLIGRLKEHRKKLKIGEGKIPITFEFRGGWIAAHDRIIEIVNELAEEYINCSTDISTGTSTGWIPCSINKHNEIHVAEKMWVTMRNKDSKYCFVRRLMWNGCLRRWEWDNGKPISDMWEVVAWKKIDVPAPYTEGESR